MDKEYRFCYNGTKEIFNQLLQKTNSEDYIISTIDGKISFGIERAGHSGGYWFVPDIVEYDDRIELVGKIQYFGPEDHRNGKTKRKDKIWEIVATIFLFPLICIFAIVYFIEKALNKNEKKTKPMTRYEKLLDLMKNHLGCTEVKNTSP